VSGEFFHYSLQRISTSSYYRKREWNWRCVVMQKGYFVHEEFYSNNEYSLYLWDSFIDGKCPEGVWL